MSKIPDHLKHSHLSLWALGSTVVGCALAVFSPVFINKYPQWAIAGTATGGVLSGVGWVMACQSEKASKLQAKLEEQTELSYLRRLGMEHELERFRDAMYLEQSQRAIIQQSLPPRPPRPIEAEPEDKPRGSLMVLDREEITPPTSLPRIAPSPVEAVLARGYFESIEELKTVIWTEENAWFKACVLNKLLMMVGDQGSGKTTLAQFILGCRILLKGHFVYAADPHAEKNGWNNCIDVIGHQKDWSGVSNRIDKYFEVTTNTLEDDDQQYSFLFDEMTQYKDCLQDKDKAALMLKSWCSDVRKSAVSIICLTHNDTCEALAGVKGMKASIDSSFLRLYLANQSDPDTGKLKPAHRGYVENFKKDARNQSISVEIKTQVWMQFKFLQPLFDKLTPSEPVTVQSVTLPHTPQDDPLNPDTWQRRSYPSELQWLPQHEAGVYGVYVDSNLLYIGQSTDLWKRWNATGDRSHHIKPYLDKAINQGLKVAIAFLITKGLSDQQRLSLESQLQAKYHTPWNGTANKSIPEKSLSETAEAVYQFLCEISTGDPIPARECYRKSSLKTQYGVTPESIESVFEELESFGLGRKIVKDVNNFRSVNFLLTHP